MGLAAAESVFEHTRKYCKERKAFGKPLEALQVRPILCTLVTVLDVNIFVDFVENCFHEPSWELTRNLEQIFDIHSGSVVIKGTIRHSRAILEVATIGQQTFVVCFRVSFHFDRPSDHPPQACGDQDGARGWSCVC